MLQPKKRSRRCRFFLPPPTSSSRFSIFIVIFHTVSSCNAASCTLILQRSGEPNKPKCLAASTKPAAEAAEPRCYRPSAGGKWPMASGPHMEETRLGCLINLNYCGLQTTSDDFLQAGGSISQEKLRKTEHSGAGSFSY